MAGLLGEPHELLQERLLGLDLPLVVGLQPYGLQLLRPHRHRQLLLLCFGLLPSLLHLHGFNIEFELSFLYYHKVHF